MASPIVSVIIPCYNAEQFIGEAIGSVLEQTLEDFELIVIDDGSTDGSTSVVESFSDKRLKYHKTANHGVSHARNTGIRMATGKYIAFLDADDLFLKENLTRKTAYLDDHPDIGFVHAREVIFNSDSGELLSTSDGLGGEVLPQLLALTNTVIHSPSSVVVRRSVLDHEGLFDEQLSIAADWEMWVRLARGNRLGFITEPLSKYRIHNAQMHHNIPAMEHDMIMTFDRLKSEGYFKGPSDHKKCSSKLFLTLGLCYLMVPGQRLTGLKYLVKSIFTSPSSFMKYLSQKLS